jgi:Kef-type K+ transport system membrane component KefB
MHYIVSLTADAVVFIALPWGVWCLLGRRIPFAVLPIMIGLGVAASGNAATTLGIPSAPGALLGWAGVLLLAFAAGAETRLRAVTAEAGERCAPRIAVPVGRLFGSAFAALMLPLLSGTAFAYFLLIDLPNWAAARAPGWLGAAAIGLCLSVSALPVLIGIVRELAAEHCALGNVALQVAVVDDAALWTGLALLLLVADGRSAVEDWDGYDVFAIVTIALLAIVGRGFRRQKLLMPTSPACMIALAYLGAGAWASSQLGLHPLLGAYFGGALMAPAWLRTLPTEQMGWVALFCLSALFFGHSGLRVQGAALTWGSFVAACSLFLLSASAKLLAAYAYPTSGSLSIRESLAVGALLQCKGLMEIAAATILREEGLISENAFAALITLAVVSTLLTGPLFRVIAGRKQRAFAPTRGRALP